MKAPTKYYVKNTWLLLPILMVMLLGATGCMTTINPLEGWTFRPFDDFAPPAARHHYYLDKAIVDDYQNFMTERKLQTIGAITGFYEDGTGQHAIEFEGYKGHTSWHYILFYDKENKRSRTIKYNRTRYRS
jgi:hypothetical protein